MMIAVLAQRLVEASPGHAGLLGELTDAAGAPDVPQGGGDEGRIVAAFLQAGLEVKPTCPAKSKGLAVSS